MASRIADRIISCPHARPPNRPNSAMLRRSCPPQPVQYFPDLPVSDRTRAVQWLKTDLQCPALTGRRCDGCRRDRPRCGRPARRRARRQGWCDGHLSPCRADHGRRYPADALRIPLGAARGEERDKSRPDRQVPDDLSSFHLDSTPLSLRARIALWRCSRVSIRQYVASTVPGSPRFPVRAGVSGGSRRGGALPARRSSRGEADRSVVSVQKARRHCTGYEYNAEGGISKSNRQGFSRQSTSAWAHA